MCIGSYQELGTGKQELLFMVTEFLFGLMKKFWT